MKILVRALVVLVALSLFLYLFVRSARSVRSQAYVVSAPHLSSWRLATESGALPGSPVLVLRPAPELGSGLFNQIFARMMESMKGRPASGIPLVLRSELEGPLAGHHTVESLLEAARAADLESIRPEPVCVAMRRVSEPGLTRQVYFVLFDAPEIREFRRQLAAGLPPQQGSSFDPFAQAPVMIVAASDDGFDAWLPIAANTDDECVAPIVVE
ncbi:MAG: hypothetical protein DIU54_009690 [Acidobacteriota bacterium]|jgi:hypothetical protein|nr:MAG: hypothetical protein DIU54_07515 [Acidobacteriota bacterium]